MRIAQMNLFTANPKTKPPNNHYQVLRDFRKWMWRNTDFRDLVASIRSYNNSGKPGISRAGIYGMDLYGLSESTEAVIEYLKRR
jgi:erythromycin esterase-like protein